MLKNSLLYLFSSLVESSAKLLQYKIWKFHIKCEGSFDYADDVAVLVCTQAQIRDKTDKVWQAARRMRLEINAPKSNVMCINATLNTPLTIAGETLEFVDSFTYLGSVISKDGSAQKDIKNRLYKTRNALASLWSVWRSSVYSTRIKLHLYNSIAKLVLLYRSECWKVI